MILLYVISFFLFAGIPCLCTKNIVFIPCTQPGIHCASLPLSLPYECCHVCLYCGCLLSCLYSKTTPMLSSIMAPAKSSFPFFWVDAGVANGSLMDNIHSWVIVQVAVQEHVLAAGLVFLCSGDSSSYASSWEMMWGR